MLYDIRSVLIRLGCGPVPAAPSAARYMRAVNALRSHRLPRSVRLGSKRHLHALAASPAVHHHFARGRRQYFHGADRVHFGGTFYRGASARVHSSDRGRSPARSSQLQTPAWCPCADCARRRGVLGSLHNWARRWPVWRSRPRWRWMANLGRLATISTVENRPVGSSWCWQPCFR